MYPFWHIDEASRAGLRDGQPETAAQANCAGVGAPFLSQVEQLLGEDAEPDASFFVESWTVGVAAASDNFRRREQARKSHDYNMPAGNHSFRFPPFFAGVIDEARPCGDAYGEDDPQWPGDEIGMECPLTLGSACRVLGVATASSREQIRAAYRKMASRYHPDRLARAGAHAQKLAGDRMAAINESYRLLLESQEQRIAM